MADETPAPRPDEPTPDEPGSRPDDDATDAPARATVVMPDGTGVSVVESDDSTDPERNPATVIEEPAKVMRIGGMIKKLLDEVRDAPLDEAARSRLAEIHERSLTELEEGLSPDLVEELHRITLPFSDDTVPTDAELRVAQAQLVGWLEGLFHGIQTALVAQQMAAQAQLSQIRRALPPGSLPPMGPGGPGGVPGRPGAHPDEHDGRPSPGQYL
ncbi:bacterial proteasome activator family protein [Cellulosimicrobium protaetiae]|uniref:Bacterial proteasome activator n=1 Tax=Cellulosimicrobium protaetiae TaxID=2587808 RepID=A0A6M5ULK9_9MICO|nr:bacterial proteasome activator family protein [Cellulosimicrobium protaetiae]QJW38018.1 bacterial proteasome activator family protein [Cellulosimicrobium protaetiae]